MKHTTWRDRSIAVIAQVRRDENKVFQNGGTFMLGLIISIRSALVLFLLIIPQREMLLWREGVALPPKIATAVTPVVAEHRTPLQLTSNDGLALVNFGARNEFGFEPMTGASDCMLSAYANMAGIRHRAFYAAYIEDLGYIPKMWGWDLRDEPADPNVMSITVRRMTGKPFAAREAPLTPELLGAAPYGAVINAYHGYNKIGFDGTTLTVFTQWREQPTATFTLEYGRASVFSKIETWSLVKPDGTKVNNVTITFTDR